MQFPQYRKLRGGIKYFSILSADEWEEASYLGKKLLLKRHKALHYPEKILVQDMLLCQAENFETATAEEYRAYLETQ